MSWIDAIALIVFAIIGPVPMLFHLLLHAALPFWRRHVRAFYVVCGVAWIAWIAGLLRAASWLTVPVVTPSTYLAIPALILSLVALCIVPWTIATLGWRRFFVYAVLRSDRVPTVARVTGGPFRWFRHPAYTAYRISAIFLVFASGSRGAILLAIYTLILFPIIIRLEEHELQQRLRAA